MRQAAHALHAFAAGPCCPSDLSRRRCIRLLCRHGGGALMCQTPFELLLCPRRPCIAPARSAHPHGLLIIVALELSAAGQGHTHRGLSQHQAGDGLVTDEQEYNTLCLMHSIHG